MKVGILTYHSQLNYGGILQAYALQEALKAFGYEPVILDRWLGLNKAGGNIRLDEERISPCQCVSSFIRGCFMTGRNILPRRRRKTKAFICSHLNLSKKHFLRWEDVSETDMGVDCLVIGSDQVWNSAYSDADDEYKFYLLEGAPHIPAIAYAASMGMHEIDGGKARTYQEGWKRFRAISVRERETIGIMEGLGAEAVHVVDPTLLLPRENWLAITSASQCREKRLFCYFMSNQLHEVLPELEAYSQATGSRVDVFLSEHIPIEVPLPLGARRSREWLRWLRYTQFKPSSICLHLDAAPDEFLQCVSQATDVVSDSFHALMFSIVFGLNVRMIRPSNVLRQGMFARIEEFTGCMRSGKLISADLRSALYSIRQEKPVTFDAAKIEERRAFSERWLRVHLDDIRNILKK